MAQQEYLTISSDPQNTLIAWARILNTLLSTLSSNGTVFIAPDTIDESMVDWGTGSGQVSAEDMPINDLGSYFTTDNVNAALQQLASLITAGTLTANRLVSTDSEQKLASVTNLGSWITGTTNRVTVTDDLDGTVTLNLPQDIHDGASPTLAGLTISGNAISVETTKTPSSATDTGTKGQICWDSNYIYVCINTDTWKRVAINTW